MASKNTGKVISIKNLDKEFINWHPDFVVISYKLSSKNVKMTLSEFREKFADKTDMPELESFKPLDVEENVLKLLQHYSLELKYNVVTGKFNVFHKGIICKKSIEYHAGKIRSMGIKHGFKITRDRLRELLLCIGFDNDYNPIKEYLQECYKYYLKHKDDTIFDKLCNTIDSSFIDKKKYLNKFLLQMVYLGCSEEDGQERSNNVLVLQGPQTIGKTSWLENLLPKKMRNDYFLGGRALDLNNKDHIMETLSNWLVELGEIESTFRKSDQEMLKNFITAKKDRYRPPYHAESIDKKRRTSLSSTTNDYSYLRDVTGNRRYLTIPCKDVNYEHNLDLDMLWGYFYSKYLKGEQYWFSKDENRQISKTNEEFLNKPDWFMLIEEVFIINDKDYNKENWMKAKDAYEKLSLDEKSIIKNHLALGKKFSSMAVEKRVTNGVTFYNVHPKWKNV